MLDLLLALLAFSFGFSLRGPLYTVLDSTIFGRPRRYPQTFLDF